MPIPQVNDRIKEAPVVVLRAVFAGIGQILLTADKVRARAAEQVWTPDRAPVPGLRSTAPGPRNGTTHAEPAFAEHSASRAAPVSPAAAPATKTAPASSSSYATPEICESGAVIHKRRRYPRKRASLVGFDRRICLGSGARPHR